MQIDYENIISRLEAGTLVLTVNNRLSRHLAMKYGSVMKARGFGAWPTPTVLPMGAWLAEEWRLSMAPRPLLTPVRAAALWERITASDEIFKSSELAFDQSIAYKSYEAYGLCREYGLRLNESTLYLSEEAAAFKRWSALYDKELERLGFIDQSHLADNLASLIREGSIDLPEEIIIAGFDEIKPSYRALIKALEDMGKRIIYFQSRDPNEAQVDLKLDEAVLISTYPTELDEVRSAARWARSECEKGLKSAVVVPNLSRYRAMIEREFSAELYPESMLPASFDRALASNVFNISLAPKLAEHPLAASALALLSVGPSRMELEKLSSILFSPYLHKSPSDYLALARADASFRKDNMQRAGLSQVVRFLEDNQGDLELSALPDLPSLPSLIDRLRAWRQVIYDAPRRALPGQWAKYFIDLMKRLGWPAITLNSAEYQTLNAWKKLFENFATLDEMTGLMSRAEAVSKISRMARESSFQPESPDAPVQVLGLRETVGLDFDSVWIIGAHDGALPPESSWNPFIPLDLQRAARLPGSTPEVSRAFTLHLLKGLLAGATKVWASSPKISEDKERRLSTLFANPIPAEGEGEGPLADSAHSLLRRLFEERDLEEMEGEVDIPISAEELEGIRGGTSILKDQSACPFRAFVSHRLRARALNEPKPGLQATEHGTITHLALMKFWKRVKGSDGLRELTNEGGGLHGVVKEVVIEALEETAKRSSLPGKEQGNLERDRVEKLILEWLAVESTRAGFEVKDLERSFQVKVGGLSLEVTVDRIDRLETGQLVLIDYKTGRINKKDWNPERPLEPQLPIYDLTDDYDALAFAAILPGDCAFKGVAAEDDLLPGLKGFDSDYWCKKLETVDDYEGLRNEWHTALDILGREFTRGLCKVEPQTGGNSPCTYCDYKTLCMISRLRPGLETAEEGELDG